MRFFDVLNSGIQDLKAQRRKNVISFILICMSIVIYVGVNSTINGMEKGAYDVVNGHGTRILYTEANGDFEERFEYVMQKYGNDDRVQEIYTGISYYIGMVWYGCENVLGVEKNDMFFSTAYYSIFNYDYKGEKRLPEYDEIILPRYIYEYGIYDEYNCATTDDLIGKTLTFKNEAYKYGESGLEEHKLKVIGTYDNISKVLHHYVILANQDFMNDIYDVYYQRMLEKNPPEYDEEGNVIGGAKKSERVYLFIKEGNDVVKVYNEINADLKQEFKVHPLDNALEYMVILDPEVKSYYYYIIAVGNIVSLFLLCIAVINIFISSISEVKDRRWEFALKRAMGYEYRDIVKIFAVEKIVNVLKAIGVSLFVLFLYSGALTYYNKNELEYWKASWVITIDLQTTITSIIAVVIVALMGVVVANMTMSNINISDTLKAGE